MNYLSIEQVLFIHARVVAETGGSHGLRDLGGLQSAVARSEATFEGEELYADLFNKAAALMHSIINNHPFVDGNKRTGVAAAAVLLRRNGWNLRPEADELEAQTMRVASEGVRVEDLADWLRANSVKED